MSLKISVSGVRGIWGDSLDWDVLSKYTSAFAHYVLSKNGKTILLGRDNRSTGIIMSQFVTSVFNMMGIDVVDLGIVPTPVVLYGVRTHDYDAGLILTASHNSIEWNAFKFVKSNGLFIDEKEFTVIESYYNNSPTIVRWDHIGQTYQNTSLIDEYLDHILSVVDVPLIQNSGLTVLLDSGNGAGSFITKTLLQRLSIKSYFCHDQIHGHFDRPSEPTPQNLSHLKPLVLKNMVDVAFAQDPDADRLVVSDEKGEILSEEITGVLALKDLLEKGERGPLVINTSTSSMSSILNKTYSQDTYRTPVGEANVVAKIQDVSAIYGMEGNGGVIYPKANLARDSLVGIILILELLARQKISLSSIVKTLPLFFMKKEKEIFEGDFDILSENVKKAFPNVTFDVSDGLRAVLDDNTWFHLRLSNTEPVIRLIAESNSQDCLTQVLTNVRKLIKDL